MLYNRDNVIEIFRDKVLKALDAAANETFHPTRNDSGATDADLPRLFKAIDEQVEVLAARYNACLLEPDQMPSPDYIAEERRQIDAIRYRNQ